MSSSRRPQLPGRVENMLPNIDLPAAVSTAAHGVTSSTARRPQRGHVYIRVVLLDQPQLLEQRLRCSREHPLTPSPAAAASTTALGLYRCSPRPGER
ncbi:hypothetical protein [Streptomyces sp. NPDC018584]|uniref:hypothetical protein n=1 Tax=unclassified Streptomyces TaxID=2593676 RepID=UPI0037B81C42